MKCAGKLILLLTVLSVEQMLQQQIKSSKR